MEVYIIHFNIIIRREPTKGKLIIESNKAKYLRVFTLRIVVLRIVGVASCPLRIVVMRVVVSRIVGLPILSYEAEYSFSEVRRLKTYLRFNMR